METTNTAKQAKQKATQKGMLAWLTKKQLRRVKQSASTPGKEKGLNCQATSLEKAMAKYPRSYRNNNKKEFASWDHDCQKYWR